MQFGLEQATKSTPIMTFWPAVVAAFFWVENGSNIYLYVFTILSLSGGVSYLFTRILWNNQEQYRTIKTNQINPPVKLSFQQIRDYIGSISPLFNSALPNNNMSFTITIASLVIVLLGFLGFWIRSSLYLYIESDPMVAIATLGLLPYFFFSVVIGALPFYFDG